MHLCEFILRIAARIYWQKFWRIHLIVALILGFQASEFNESFAQDERTKTKIVEKTEVVQNKNSALSKNPRQVEPEVYLGKIYMMPPELSQESGKKRIEQAQNDLLNLYRERQLIQRTLKRLEDRASRRQRKAKKVARRPCI